MNRDEFAYQLSRLGHEDPDFVKHAFAAFDTDRNGSVDFKEFVTGMSILTRGNANDKYQFGFKMWDSDNDGAINKHEFHQLLHLSQGVEVSDSILNQLWADADIDCDGLINFEECKRAISRHQLINPGENFMGSDVSSIPETLRDLFSIIGQKIHYKAGEVFVTEGSPLRFVYFLSKGAVQITRKSVPILNVKEKSVFGAEGLLDVTSSWTMTTEKDSTLLRINVEDLMPMIFHNHAAAICLVEQLMSRLMSTFQEVTMLALQHKELATDTEWHQSRAEALAKVSLYYHSLGKNGKLEIRATKQVGSAEDLSVAYSPGVAEPCLAIKAHPDKAYDYTAKGHLVGVVSNGTAVLGLGNIGAAASKPVMEGKAVLFKKFGGIDAFDIELDCSDPDKFIDMVVALGPTFGGINIEDVKAPECFYIEKEAQRRSDIPIMHDDQHGTAIIAGAGLLNALQLVKKDIGTIKVVVSGCGAAGFTCAKYFISLGVKPENLIAVDINGVVYKGRPDINEKNKNTYLNEVASSTSKRTLQEAIVDADVFLGVSAAGLLKAEMLQSMAKDPLVFALANPTPEISYSLARSTRPDVIIATGRSDFPNQINNVCAFPYIFRGALDCRATQINEAIKQACTSAIASIAMSDSIFGPDYIIPKPFDPRLKVEVSAAVAQAAMDTGVARIQLDIQQYKELLRTE